MDMSLEDIRKATFSDVSLLKSLLPNVKQNGCEYRAGSIRGDKGESFSYNITTGAFADFADDSVRGCGMIDLVMQQKNISTHEAIEFLKRHLGSSDTIEKKEPVKEVEKPLDECPYDIFPEYVYVNKGNQRVSKFWAYKDNSGRVFGYDCRVDFKDGSKAVIPMRWSAESNRFFQGMLPEKRMLYGLQDLDTSKKVMIVEGCKSAEAAKHYFNNWCVISWQGGSNAVHKSDWSVIKDKDVLLFPDADRKEKNGVVLDWSEQTGQKAMINIAKKLHKKNKVKIIDTKDMGKIKDGWDIADALESNMSKVDLVGFVKENMYDYVEEEETINVVVEKKEDDIGYDDTFFRCLGERGSSTFFFKWKSGQVIEFTPSKYEQKHLVHLAPLSFWSYLFASKAGVDWLQACDFLSRVQEKVGYFNPLNIRGRGCWFDEGKVVLHLGDSLVVDGKPKTLKAFRTKNIYEKREPIYLNLNSPLESRYSSKLIDICCMARWEEDYYGEILAGWIFSAMVCGAMRFRSHLYLIGQSGSGKSWLQDFLIKPLMGKMCIKVSSKTTEAGIRASLNNDILPVVCDENEVEDSKKDKETLEAIFALARNASSENSEPIVKSSPTGQVKVYYCRSAFLFSSIKTSMEKTADLNRTAFIRLKGKPESNATETEKLMDSKKFEKLRESVYNLIDDDYCECLLARAIKLASVMRESQKVISDVSARLFGDRRQGDQMGMVIAGLHALKTELVILPNEAENYLNKLIKNKERIYSKDDDKQEQLCLDSLLRMPVKVSVNTYPLARLIAFLLDKDTIFETKQDVEKMLLYFGIKVDSKYLYLSTKPSSEHCIYFKDKTMYGTKGWIDEMHRCSTRVQEKVVRFTASLTSRALLIPMDKIIKEDEE